MKLHLDKEAFRTLLINESNQTKIRADIIEKDYFVTLMLQELSLKQGKVKTYFKGGTALYKALKSIQRFSEDIDLTVSKEGCPSNTQAKKRLEDSAQGFKSLPRDVNDPSNENQKESITCIYRYESVFESNQEDPLHRFGRIKVESTSFTISEPHEFLEIEPMVYEFAETNQKEILTKSYDVSPFSIDTIKLERIFMDKVFAVEFFYQRNQFSDAAKHFYDIIILLTNDKIERLLKDFKQLKTVLTLTRNEQSYRYGMSGLVCKSRLC
jgi:predicted nucleotidyltransferase component of viral defense system